MTRPPHAASSVVGYASDTASAVAKVEPNSNRSRETGRPYEEMSHSENAAALLSQMRFQNADAISKRRCDFKTQMRFQNADVIFKTQMRFQNADAISKRRCDFKTQMRLQDPWVPVLRM